MPREPGADATPSPLDSDPGTARSETKLVRNVRVSIEWGDDVHDCPMAMRTWRRIVAGKPVQRVEPYRYEGARFVARWHFNHVGAGTLLVTYDGEGTGFDGELSDAWIEIDGRKVPWVSEVASPGGEQAPGVPPGTGRELEFPTLESGAPGFTATQMDGPDVDLVALAGLTLTDAQADRLVDDFDWEEIVTECGGDVIEVEEFEGGPGQSDTFYEVEVDDPPRFVALLREVLWTRASD